MQMVQGAVKVFANMKTQRHSVNLHYANENDQQPL